MKDGIDLASCCRFRFKTSVFSGTDSTSISPDIAMTEEHWGSWRYEKGMIWRTGEHK